MSWFSYSFLKFLFRIGLWLIYSVVLVSYVQKKYVYYVASLYIYYIYKLISYILYIYNFTFLYIRNWHNIISQL